MFPLRSERSRKQEGFRAGLNSDWHVAAFSVFIWSFEHFWSWVEDRGFVLVGLWLHRGLPAECCVWDSEEDKKQAQMENGGIYFTQQRLHALQPPAVVLVTCRMRLSVAHCRRQYLLTVKQVVFSPRYSLISSQVKFDPVHAGCTHTHKYQGQYIAATVTLRFCYLRPNNRNYFFKDAL